PEVLRDLSDRRFAVAGHRDHVTAELDRIRLGHDDILPARTNPRRSGVNRTGGSPLRFTTCMRAMRTVSTTTAALAAAAAAAALTMTAAALVTSVSDADHKVPPNFNSVTGQVAAPDGIDGAVTVLAYGTKQKAWTP